MKLGSFNEPEAPEVPAGWEPAEDNIAPPEQPTSGLSWQPNEQADLQQVQNTEGHGLYELHHEWYNRFNEAHAAHNDDLQTYAYRMMRQVSDRIYPPNTPDIIPESDTPTETEPRQSDTGQTVEDPLAQHDWNEPLSERPDELQGVQPLPDVETTSSGRVLSRSQRADVRTIRNATTSTRLNELYRQWTEEYQDARRYDDESGMRHAREMSELIDERLTDEFGDTGATRSGGEPSSTDQWEVFYSADGEPIARFASRSQALDYIDAHPDSNRLDMGRATPQPMSTIERGMTTEQRAQANLQKLREATGIPNPPVKFGLQDPSEPIRELTNAQLARLRGGAGTDPRINAKGKKPKELRKVDPNRGPDNMVKEKLARIPDGPPGLFIKDTSYPGHPDYELIYRNAEGKPTAYAHVKEDPVTHWRTVPYLMADRAKGGNAAMIVMSKLAEMNAAEQSGYITGHTAHIIAKMTQRAAKKAAIAKKMEGSVVPPPD